MMINSKEPIKSLGLILNFILITFLIALLPNSIHSQPSLRKVLRKAAHNTYVEGTFSYSLEHKKLTPDLDTFTDIYSVLLKNAKNEFSLITRHRDSLFETYYNNLSLRCNSNTKTYWLENFEHEDAIYEFEGIYKPFIDKTFNDYFVDDSVQIEKISDDHERIILKVVLPDDEDISELFFLVTILKHSNTIGEYGSHAKVGGIEIYESWKMLSKSNIYKEPDSSATIKQKFYTTIRTFKPYCSNNPVKEPASEKLTLTELNGILPTLHLVSTQNDTLVLNQLHSNYYLVDFWFRSCYPCIKSVPVLRELHTKYDENYLKIVSINNVDKSKDLIEKFKKDNSIPYEVYLESAEYGKKFEGIHSYPTFIIFDNHFNVIETFNGYRDTLLDEIEQIVKQK